MALEPGPARKRARLAMAAPTADSGAPPVSAAAYKWSERNVFAAINEGRVPADKIFNRPHYYALLDKMPLTPGHCLLITKHPAATLLENMPPEAMADTMADLQALTRAVQKATGCLGVRVRQNNGPAAGQVVPQLHFHVIPVQAPGDEEAAQREPLQDDAAGPLLASLRNALPPAYSGPGVHVWVPDADSMEALGQLLHSLCVPGTAVLLSGHLGSGKTSIARGLVRAGVGDPHLFVPSPTFLLNLSYEEDTAHEPRSTSESAQAPQQQAGQQAGQPQRLEQQVGAANSQQAANEQGQQDMSQQQQQQQKQQQDGQQQQADAVAPCAPRRGARSIHHMDPYRLGTPDKMAGLIDFGYAFENDVSIIEWPSRMPGSVMCLPRRRTIEVTIAGSGAQAAGRLVHIACTQEEGCGQPEAAPAANVNQQEPPQHQSSQKQKKQQQTDTAAALTPAAGSSSSGSSGGGGGPCAQQLLRWRQEGLPQPQVHWTAAGREQDCSSEQQRALLTGGGSSSRGRVPAGPPESWLVLGIESSCDDTAAAVVRGDGTVLSHVIASQAGLHEQYGGVKPDVARDAHAAAISATVDSAVAQAGLRPEQLSAVAVTIGPGLSLCLQVGVRHALTLAAQHQLPWVPVHHMEAHALVAGMPGILQQQEQQQQQQPPPPPQQQQQQQQLLPAGLTFPALLLLVSGGHNMLVRCDGVGRHTVLGTTIDDSMGEAFDKVARLLGIRAVPGGPYLERLAAAALPEDLARYKGKLPLPLRQDRSSCNFSFSGLKTSIGKLVETEKARLADEGADEAAVNRTYAALAALFQDVSVRFLEERTERALARSRQDAAEAGQAMVTCLVVAGGVAANSRVRGALQQVAGRFGLPCIVPPPAYCSDNGLMVAWTGLQRLRLGLCRAPPPAGMSSQQVDGAVEVLPRWPLGPVDVRGMTKQNARHCKLLH